MGEVDKSSLSDFKGKDCGFNRSGDLDWLSPKLTRVESKRNKSEEEAEMTSINTEI